MRVCTGDLESDGLLYEATKVHCGVFKDRNTKQVWKFRPHQIKEMLEFMDTIDELWMHNGVGYDWPLLERLHGYTYKGIKRDTLIMSRLLRPKRILPVACPNRKVGPHSVEAWGYRVGRGKPEHNDWANFSEDMLHRCSEDVEIQELIGDKLLEETGEDNWDNAFRLTYKLFENLQKQEEYGWLVDQPHMHFCVRQLTKWIERIDKTILPRLPQILEVEETKTNGQYNYIKKPFLKSGKYSEHINNWYARIHRSPDDLPIMGVFSRINFRPVDLNSGDETKDLLLSLGWEPAEWNIDDEGERTSPKLSKDDPFEGVDGKLGRLVAKRVQCRHRRSTVEGLFNLIRPDGRIASVVNTIAVTGRATHRNIVNIPKAGSFYGNQMRKIFTSKEGFVLVGTDSDSCQLRMLAGRMNNPAYTEALCNGDKKLGTDNHSLTMKAADLESRDIAKNVMYCLLFGGQDKKLANTAKQPGNGAVVRQKLYRGLDGLEELVKNLEEQWMETAKWRFSAKWNKMEPFDGKIIGLDGRPITVGSKHALLVYLLQSDEALMMTAAYNLLWKRLSSKYEFGKDFGVVCFYHDEFTIECKESIAEDVRKISETCIVDAGKFFKISCPHVGDGKIGRNWFSIH